MTKCHEKLRSKSIYQMPITKTWAEHTRLFVTPTRRIAQLGSLRPIRAPRSHIEIVTYSDRPHNDEPNLSKEGMSEYLETACVGLSEPISSGEREDNATKVVHRRVTTDRDHANIGMYAFR